MATEPREMEDLQRICGGLLVNIGTLTSSSVEGMRNAGEFLTCTTCFIQIFFLPGASLRYC